MQQRLTQQRSQQHRSSQQPQQLGPRAVIHGYCDHETLRTIIQMSLSNAELNHSKGHVFKSLDLSEFIFQTQFQQHQSWHEIHAMNIDKMHLEVIFSLPKVISNYLH